MKVRTRKVQAQSSGVRVSVVPLEAATRMMTFSDPNAAPHEATGAFARLHPPPDYPADETSAWRARVRAHAVAVQVDNVHGQTAPVAAAAMRAERAGVAYRDVVHAIAQETGDERVIALVTQVMDEIGC